MAVARLVAERGNEAVGEVSPDRLLEALERRLPVSALGRHES